MNKEFIPYEQALELKELGFDEECFGYYVLERNGDYKLYDKCEVKTYFTYIKAPTFSQAFRCFREKHGYYCEFFVDDYKTFGFLISYFVEIGRCDKPTKREFKTYEEAELECLKKLIEIVKEDK